MNALSARYPNTDTRSEEFRRVVIEDALAASMPTAATAMIVEAIRKAFPPKTAQQIYRAIGASAEDQE